MHEADALIGTFDDAASREASRDSAHHNERDSLLARIATLEREAAAREEAHTLAREEARELLAAQAEKVAELERAAVAREAAREVELRAAAGALDRWRQATDDAVAESQQLRDELAVTRFASSFVFFFIHFFPARVRRGGA